MTDINDKLDSVIENISSDPELSKEQVKDIICMLKNIDSDMSPLLELLEELINDYGVASSRGKAVKKLLEFYGFNNPDRNMGYYNGKL
jgi:hypothetical protein